MRYKTEVYKLAIGLGAKIEVDRSGLSLDIRVEAPHGKVWSDWDLHELVSSISIGPWSYVPAWKDMYERMAAGVKPCATENCEWCNGD